MSTTHASTENPHTPIPTDASKYRNTSSTLQGCSHSKDLTLDLLESEQLSKASQIITSQHTTMHSELEEPDCISQCYSKVSRHFKTQAHKSMQTLHITP